MEDLPTHPGYEYARLRQTVALSETKRCRLFVLSCVPEKKNTCSFFVCAYIAAAGEKYSQHIQSSTDAL